MASPELTSANLESQASFESALHVERSVLGTSLPGVFEGITSLDIG